MPPSSLTITCLAAALFLGSPPLPCIGQEASSALRVMTFNIRYGTAEDGPNDWANRRGAVAGIIAQENPDVLAIQEALAFQLQELAPVLGAYRKLGQHRDGGLEGEFSGLYVREDRVHVLDWGEMWLSPAPDSVGSRGWDAALPRMAVWADVELREGGGPLRVYGTHFDHRGVSARVESARLLTAHAREGPPAVIMGDLNAMEESEALQVFFRVGFRSAVTLLNPGSDGGTFNGFRDPGGGGRIDHILLASGLEPLRGEILHGKRDGVWPSDHFPVVAAISSPPPLRRHKPAD